MVRYYFPATELVVGTGAGTPAALVLAPAAEFTVWSAETGGTKYTDLKAADGTTALPVNGSGNPFCDSNGWPPDLWGPDGVKEMWRQVGTQRSPMYPSTEVFATITSAARTNTANTFSGAVSFTSGTATAFSTTPTVAGSAVTTAGTFNGLYDTRAVAYGQRIVLYYNGTTWPALSTVPAAYIAAGTPITWDSEDYLGAPDPPEARDNDRWNKRIAA